MTWREFKEDLLLLFFGIEPPPREVMRKSQQAAPWPEKSERKAYKHKPFWKRPEEIVAPVRHVKIYVFIITMGGQTTTECKTCGKQNSVFSDANDAANQPVRFCLECLERFGGPEQVNRAAQKSKYARRWLEAREALGKLERLFPDIQRRPLGTKTLVSEMEYPFSTGEKALPIIQKIEREAWTRYDQEVLNDGLDAVEERWRRNRNG